MKSFASIIVLAFAAMVSAQAPAGAPPAGGAQDAPCPPQFTLQCCGHVVSVQDAGLFKVNVNPAQNPGLVATGCNALNPTGGQCAQTNYPVCCKSVQSAYSAGCIPA